MFLLSLSWFELSCAIWTSWLCYGISLVTYRLFFHPLASFPGRKLAAATRWYEFYYDCINGDGGQYMWEVERMHQEYGPIVRVTPHEIHVQDPEWYDVLYAVGPPRDKYRPSAKMAGTPLSSFGTEPHYLHKTRRAPLVPFFSKRSVAALQPQLQEKVDDLCDGIRDHLQKNTVVDLRPAFLALTIDVIFTYAFGMSLGALKHPGFSPWWNDAVEGTASSAPITKQLTTIVGYLQKLPVSVIRFFHPNLGQLLTLRKMIRTRVVAIIAEYNPKTPKQKLTSGSTPTIFHTLMEADIPKQEKEEERLTDEAFALVGAGTETTKQTLNGLCYHLLVNTDHLALLKQELWKAIPDCREIPELHVLENLPYLSSIVKEGLRISNSVTSRLPLIAPDQSLQYENWTIPAGTPVSMSLGTLLMNPSIFPSPSTFSPSRWLEAKANSDSLTQYLRPFSRGTRACMGQNLALAEIYLTVATLFRRFEMELFETDAAAVRITRDCFAAGLDLRSKGTRVKVLREYVH